MQKNVPFQYTETEPPVSSMLIIDVCNTEITFQVFAVQMSGKKKRQLSLHHDHEINSMKLVLWHKVMVILFRVFHSALLEALFIFSWLHAFVKSLLVIMCKAFRYLSYYQFIIRESLYSPGLYTQPSATLASIISQASSSWSLNLIIVFSLLLQTIAPMYSSHHPILKCCLQTWKLRAHPIKMWQEQRNKKFIQSK